MFLQHPTQQLPRPQCNLAKSRLTSAVQSTTRLGAPLIHLVFLSIWGHGSKRLDVSGITCSSTSPVNGSHSNYDTRQIAGPFSTCQAALLWASVLLLSYWHCSPLKCSFLCQLWGTNWAATHRSQWVWILPVPRGLRHKCLSVGAGACRHCQLRCGQQLGCTAPRDTSLHGKSFLWLNPCSPQEKGKIKEDRPLRSEQSHKEGERSAYSEQGFYF